MCPAYCEEVCYRTTWVVDHLWRVPLEKLTEIVAAPLGVIRDQPDSACGTGQFEGLSEVAELVETVSRSQMRLLVVVTSAHVDDDCFAVINGDVFGECGVDELLQLIACEFLGEALIPRCLTQNLRS